MLILFLSPDEAFVLSEPHVSAMFQCLEAVEQNNPRLLALIDTVRVSARARARARAHSLISAWLLVTCDQFIC